MPARRLLVALALCGAAAIACHDSSPTGPALQPLYITNGPDSATHSGTAGGQQSTSPREVGGWVMGMGPTGDTANYARVAGVLVTVRMPDDSSTNTRGQQVGSATSASDGTFSFGKLAPGPYILEATPPSGSPYAPIHWGFLVSEYAPQEIQLGVVLYRQ